MMTTETISTTELRVPGRSVFLHHYVVERGGRRGGRHCRRLQEAGAMQEACPLNVGVPCVMCMWEGAGGGIALEWSGERVVERAPVLRRAASAAAGRVSERSDARACGRVTHQSHRADEDMRRRYSAADGGVLRSRVVHADTYTGKGTRARAAEHSCVLRALVAGDV